jgi:Kef-type K+ transport system membrane component KefB
VIRAFCLRAIVVVLIAAARSFLPQETSLIGSGATLAFGFVLLASLQMGTMFSGLRLPRLTGYLLCGFVAGPSILNFVTRRMVDDLKLVNGVAIGLIALSAGGELNFRKLRSRLAAILSTGGFALSAAIVILTLVIFALSAALPFTEGMTILQRAVVALTMAVVFSALSPTVTLALISETSAAGPLCDTALGIVVVADLVIVIGFAAVKALADATFGSEAGGGAGALMIHIFGSIAVGLVLGLVLLLYLKKVNQRVALFIVGICFLCAEAGTRLHLDPLLMCLTAGLFLENLTDIEGSKLVHEIQPAAMPVFAVFFAVAGAGLHLDVFTERVTQTDGSEVSHVRWIVLLLAATLVVVRAGALVLGARFGMAAGGVPLEQRRFLPYSLMSQSGVAIGLAVLLAKHFAGWGEGASALLLGGIMTNELIGPVLFRAALVRSGEAGKAGPRVAGAVAH